MNRERTRRIAELAAEHGRMVFATAYRILGRAEDAEDALQDVFLKVLGGWRVKLDPDAVRDWGAFLRVAATRCAIDRLRRRKGEPAVIERIDTLEDRAQPDPRSQAARRQEAAMLRRALQQIPRRDAQIFALRYFEEQPYEAIADGMGLSVSSVGVALHRTRQRLRALIEPVLAAKAANPAAAPEMEQSHAAE